MITRLLATLLVCSTACLAAPQDKPAAAPSDLLSNALEYALAKSKLPESSHNLP